MVTKVLRTVAALTAIVTGLAVAFGLAWLGSNFFDEKLTPAAKVLLAPRHDPFASSDNLFVALAGFNAPSGQSMIQAGEARIGAVDRTEDVMLRDRGAGGGGASPANRPMLTGGMKSWPLFTSSIWQTAKTDRTRLAALIAANQEAYQRYLGLHELHGYFESAPSESYAVDFLAPHEVQTLFLADVADKLQTGTPTQQQAALAELRSDIRMWKAVLDGHGGLVSKIMAAVSLHADFLLLGDMVTDPNFHPAVLGDGMESVVAPFPLRDWKIGGAYGWEMRNSAPLLEAIVRPHTPPGGPDAPPVEWWQSADSRLSAQFFKLNATENLQADRMQRLCALANGDPGSFIERRDTYHEWESREFAYRMSWYNPVGRVLLALAANARYDDYPARVFDVAAFQRLVYLAYQIRRQGIPFKGISEFMKSHPEWSTHPVDARPFYWSPANDTLSVQPIGEEPRGARFSLEIVEMPQAADLQPRPASAG